MDFYSMVLPLLKWAGWHVISDNQLHQVDIDMIHGSY